MSKLRFNTTGPCVPGKHYMLDPLRGIDEELMDLIDNEHYFVMRAARQSGKTTLLVELTKMINAKGDYHALYCSLETMQEFTDPKDGIPAVVKNIKACIEEQCLPEGFAVNADYSHLTGVLKSSLVNYCRLLDKPLVIFFDEADCLSDGILVAFLKQIREGYIARSMAPFIHSVALVGMRNISDYNARIRLDFQTQGSANPFNIVTKSFNLRNFTNEEVAALYAQHTAMTGQIFEPNVSDYVFDQTQGQPWLVNAIAQECVIEITRRDYSKSITLDIAKQAVNNIILARAAHFDSLMVRFKEESIRKVIQALILGEWLDVNSDDFLYARDLGLISENNSKIAPANPIYTELIVRFLNQNVQRSIEYTHEKYNVSRYQKAGRIDMDFLIRDFQQYWRENSEIWTKRYKEDLYQYDEVAPHLVMYAFLQRIFDGSGHIVREMALGTKRADLCVVYNGYKYPIELIILQNIRKESETLEQILAYMYKVGSDTGWLVIFDLGSEKSCDEKIYIFDERINGKRIVMAGC